MKLNVKPTFKPKERRKESFVNSSFTSVSSLGSQKENRKKNKSRLDKIMNIKV